VLRTSWRQIPPSGWVLIAANLVPLFGVLLFDWSVFKVLLLFWAENLIIGFVQILRLISAANQHGEKFTLVPFFAVHYGLFTLGHGTLLLEIFGPESGIEFVDTGLFSVVTAAQQLVLADTDLLLGFTALCVSHLFSFGHNFLVKGLYQTSQPKELFAQPYGRVIIMHVTVLVGGFAAQALGSPAWALLVLVGLKLLFDLNAHLEQNRATAIVTSH